MIKNGLKIDVNEVAPLVCLWMAWVYLKRMDGILFVFSVSLYKLNGVITLWTNDELDSPLWLPKAESGKEMINGWEREVADWVWALLKQERDDYDNYFFFSDHEDLGVLVLDTFVLLWTCFRVSLVC